MNKTLACIFILNIFSSFVIAKTPNVQWEEYQGVVAVSSFLDNEMSDGRMSHYLNVFIKNLSKTDLGFRDHGRDAGIRVYYADQSGTFVPLHPYTDDILHNKEPIFIRPGRTLLRSVYLTPTEMNLLQLHLVKCQLSVYSPDIKKGYKIETTPKMLSVVH